MALLHLLNGDSTLHQINQTEIGGDRLVWREILCEGETVEAVGSSLFWKKRAAFLQIFSKSSFDKHFEKIKKDFSEIDLTQYAEVVLWFEYDLFCQINMLGLLSWLKEQPLVQTQVSLICVGEHPGYDKLVGLGEIDPQKYYQLYEKRQALNQDDLAYAARIWKGYCSDDHAGLLPLIEPSRVEKFPYLEEALRWHQKRIPNPVNGLDEIESYIVKLIAEKPLEKREIVGALLRRENFYGFGDIQYFKYLEELAPILEEVERRVGLNDLGREVYAGERSFRLLRKKGRWYGGLEVA